MDEDSSRYSSGYCKMDMAEGYGKSRKGFIHRTQTAVLLVLLALIIFILFVMIFVIFSSQERKFAELERSMLSHNSSLISVSSDLKDTLQNTGAEQEKIVTELKKSVASLSSYVDMYTSRIKNQLDTGPQVKMFSDLQTSINNLDSSLGSLSSSLETKLRDTATQQSDQNMELKKHLEHLNTSVSELAAKLQTMVGQQEAKQMEVGISLSSLNLSLASFELKQQKRNYDSDQTVMDGLRELRTKVEISSEAAESQNRTLTELSTSVQTLSSQIQSTDQRLVSTLDELKTKLEISSEASESQKRTLTEVAKLSSSVQTLSSQIQNTDQRLFSALSELKAKMEIINKAGAVPSCKPGWIPYLSKCYLFSMNTLSWHQARDYCRSQNALLLKLETKDEWAFVTARTTQYYYWVGLTDENTGQWRWDDGTPYIMNKDEWEDGQPDDWKDHGQGEGGEDCSHLKHSGKLNDAHCSNKMNYICKT